MISEKTLDLITGKFIEKLSSLPVDDSNKSPRERTIEFIKELVGSENKHVYEELLAYYNSDVDDKEMEKELNKFEKLTSLLQYKNTITSDDHTEFMKIKEGIYERKRNRKKVKKQIYDDQYHLSFGKYFNSHIDDVIKKDPKYARWLLGQKKKIPEGSAIRDKLIKFKLSELDKKKKIDKVDEVACEPMTDEEGPVGTNGHVVCTEEDEDLFRLSKQNNDDDVDEFGMVKALDR